jgi:Fe-S-cluster containining protein
MQRQNDLRSIKTIAKRKTKENEQFYVFLKGTDIPDEQIDAIVHDLYRQYAAETDCTRCRNCCKISGPLLYPADISRVARRKKVSEEQIIGDLLKPSSDEAGTFAVKSLPCPFLEANACVFGDEKPECCRDYPFLLKEKFTYRLIGVFDNYEKCPIVFNVVETLKHLIWNR